MRSDDQLNAALGVPDAFDVEDHAPLDGDGPGARPVPDALAFAGFSRMNRLRCESPLGFNHALGSWSLSDWLTAVLGELGEAANVAKKLNRCRDGIPGNDRTEDELRAEFRREIADTFIYLDLLAQSQGFALGETACEVFDAKSREIGCPITFDMMEVDECAATIS